MSRPSIAAPPANPASPWPPGGGGVPAWDSSGLRLSLRLRWRGFHHPAPWSYDQSAFSLSAGRAGVAAQSSPAVSGVAAFYSLLSPTPVFHPTSALSPCPRFPFPLVASNRLSFPPPSCLFLPQSCPQWRSSAGAALGPT